MPLISVTRLRVRSVIYLPQFLWDTFKSMRQVERSAGFLGGRLLVNPGKVFWTMTVWKDEAAMSAYRGSGAHRTAMPKLLNWCDEAALVHWTQESSEIPDWREARQRMADGGRVSKVYHPSPIQISNQIPAPQPSRIQRTLRPAVKI
ncbi:MAG: antibiotic biosynthesis monooxygenase [Candidatus Acidiferrales bacterium]